MGMFIGDDANGAVATRLVVLAQATTVFRSEAQDPMGFKSASELTRTHGGLRIVERARVPGKTAHTRHTNSD